MDVASTDSALKPIQDKIPHLDGPDLFDETPPPISFSLVNAETLPQLPPTVNEGPYYKFCDEDFFNYEDYSRHI